MSVDLAIATVLREMASAAAAAVARVHDITVAASEPRSAAAAELDEAAIAARTAFAGGTPGVVVTVVPATGLAAIPGAGGGTLGQRFVDPAMAGVAEVVARITKTPTQAASASDVPDVSSALVPPGGGVIRIDFQVGDNALLPVYWVIDPDFVTALRVEEAGAPSRAQQLPPDQESPPAQAPATPPATQPAPIPPASTPYGVSGVRESEGQVAPATFPELGVGAPHNGQRDLAFLAEVDMNVTVELGRTRMRVRDLLGLREGSVVELNRVAGAAVDVLINGTLVARGDVVVIDDELGVRVTEVVERQ